MSDLCTDNRFELIEKYKQKLIQCTNIESTPDEMAVLDNILFRFWQMGWLDKLDLPSAELEMSNLISRQAAIDVLSMMQGIVTENEVRKGISMAWQQIKDLPSAERKKGKWIWDENGIDWGLGAWCCSECGRKPETWWESDKRSNPLRCAGGRFCGNCGADMR